LWRGQGEAKERLFPGLPLFNLDNFSFPLSTCGEGQGEAKENSSRDCRNSILKKVSFPLSTCGEGQGEGEDTAHFRNSPATKCHSPAISFYITTSLIYLHLIKFTLHQLQMR
jgi:hypothetical protein